MDRPRSNTDVRAFIGAVNHYKSLWPRRSHVLAPLAALTGRGTFKWENEHQTAFDEMKAIICADAINVYPDLNKPFHIYTDASDLQLGAAIIQYNRPVAYYSKKLTSSAQKNYTTTEKKLLSIVETLKEFRNILFGYPIQVYSDHKNLVHAATISQSQRVMRWRLILEEFGQLTIQW